MEDKIIDLGGGGIEITGDNVDQLRTIGEDFDGCISDDEYGLQIWIEGNGYQLTVPGESEETSERNGGHDDLDA